MTKYEIVPATAAHAAELARTIRRDDIAELAAVRDGHFAILPLLLRSIAVSRDAQAGLADGRVVCLFGARPPVALSDTAIVWLLAAEEMPRHAFAFLRMSRAYVFRLRHSYRRMYNTVHEDNVAAIRWLRWLGFTLSEVPRPIGRNGAMFYDFEMVSDV